MRLLCIIATLATLVMIKPAQAQEEVVTSDLAAVNYHQSRANNEVTKAIELYRKGQYAAAFDMAESAKFRSDLSIFDRETANLIIAISQAKLTKENEQLVLRNYIQSTNNRTYRAEALVALANLYGELGESIKMRSTIEDIKPRLLGSSSEAMYTYMLAYLELEQGELSQSKENFESAIEQGCAKSTSARYYLAYIAYCQGRFDDAVAEYQKLVGNHEFPEVNIYIMQIRYIQEKFSEVLSIGESTLKLPLDERMKGEAIRLMGEANFNLARYPEAIADIEKYEAMGAQMNRDLYYQLGYSYYIGKDYPKSIVNFEKILSGQDALAQNAYYHLADAHIKSNNNSGAMQAFSMAANLTYDKSITEDALYNYAKLNYTSAANNLYSNKVDLLKRYIAAYPNTERTNELRGYLLSLYINGSNYDSAMVEFSRIKNPSSEIKRAIQRLCYQRGIDEFNDGDYRSAITLFNKSLQYPLVQKYYALASFWKAESLYKLNRLDNEVIELYNKYLQLSSPSMREYSMALYNIGYVHFNNRRWADAVKSFNSFTNSYKTRDGYLEDAFLRMGDAMFAQKNYPSAQQYYTKSSQVGALNPHYALYQKAISEGLMGRDSEKVKTLRNITKDSKSSLWEEASLELAQTYIKMGQSKSGVTVLESMINRKGSSQLRTKALLELGVAYSNSSNSPKAIASYKRLVKEYPQSSEAKDALAAIKSIYVAEGDAQSYITYIESLGGQYGIDAGEKEQLSFNALQRQYLNGNHKRVKELAASYKREFPKGVHSVDVQYYLVESLIISGDKGAIAAAETLTSLPDNQYTLEVLKKAAQIYASNKEYTKQHEALVRVYGLTTNQSQKREVLEALMLLAVSAVQDDKISESSANMVLADKDASDVARDYAHYALGRGAYNSGKYSEAVSQLKSSKIPLSKAEGVQARFLLADALFKLEDLGASEEIIVELSNSDTPHQYWVARAFILLGDIYLARGNAFQAKATYQSIMDGYTKDSDGIISSAKSRLKRLEPSNNEDNKE